MPMPLVDHRPTPPLATDTQKVCPECGRLGWAPKGSIERVRELLPDALEICRECASKHSLPPRAGNRFTT